MNIECQTGAKLVRNAVNGRGVYSAAKKQKLRRNWKPIFAVVRRGSQIPKRWIMTYVYVCVSQIIN